MARAPGTPESALPMRPARRSRVRDSRASSPEPAISLSRANRRIVTRTRSRAPVTCSRARAHPPRCLVVRIRRGALDPASPPSKCSCFQIGTICLMRSIAYRQAANASARCGEAAAITTLASPISQRPDAMGDRQARARPFDRRFGGNPLERFHRQRLVALVIEPDDLATGIVIAHQSDEHRDRAALRRFDGRGRRSGVERLRRYAPKPRPAGVSIGRTSAMPATSSITGAPATPSIVSLARASPATCD